MSLPESHFTLPLLKWITIPAGNVTLEKGLDDEIEMYSRYPLGIYQVAPFHISKYPVTYVQFEAFVDASDGYQNDQWWVGLAKRDKTPGAPMWKIDKHPRENVTWYEALAFCRWLSSKLRLTVTLPTESQWQWAAQGSDGHQYPWGENFDAARCNTKESGIGQTTPVDKYLDGASPFGVMDMVGNVWEWCLNKYESPLDIDVVGESSRVLRGGCWRSHRVNARSKYRFLSLPGYRSEFSIGFRLVVSVYFD
ncbi:MAG: SUMF1/EgtB/PvdO family nonheme iron enzyme [Chloroflexota bacterium]